MSKFYGQVEGGAKTIASRRGFNSIRSSVQSWDGSVILEMYYNGDDMLCIRVDVVEDDSSKHVQFGSGGVRAQLHLQCVRS